jgi:ribosomal protein S18 acetylase RimI-like enzyme
MQISVVGESDLEELLLLMRAYCDFYRANPSDAALLAMSRALIADPDREGVQFIARESGAVVVGFATVFWTWETTSGGRVGVMNDLYVAAQQRGRRVGERLIEACRSACRQHGAVRLEWQTAPDNRRAQALYDRVGANRTRWLDYWLDTR